jgi:hypothetical protein
VGPGGGREEFLGRFFEGTVEKSKMLERGGMTVGMDCGGLVGAKIEEMRGVGRGMSGALVVGAEVDGRLRLPVRAACLEW